MRFLVDLLRENPLLLLFLVAAIGYPIGKIRVGGSSLGVAAVLFTGLAFGALDPALALPEVIYLIGLVLFVYTIGLASGSIFFSSLRRKGMVYNLLVTGGLALAALMALLARELFALSGPLAAGMFAGSLTNTPALASVIENIKVAGGPEAALSQPVIAYSLTYPIGVMGMILSISLFQRIYKVNYAAEARRAPEYNHNEPIYSRTICIREDSRLDVAGLVRKHRWNVVFGRVRRDGQVALATARTVLRQGDLVTLVGTIAALDEVSQALGDASCGEQLEFDISEYDKRRFFVSEQAVAGRELRELKILERYGALVTRLRRGDTELLPHGETVLAPGDQIRVVAPRQQMDALARLFGDSYRAVSEIDILTFSLGLALGLLVGLAPIPLPGGITLRLGLAGGPLVVALLLGALGRTGPLVWAIPYSANLTLRQIGLVFFLAGIGTRAGYAFFSTLMEGSGLAILAAGAAITTVTGLLTLLVGYQVFKVPLGLMTGILAGLQTQPAVLGYALEQSQNDMPNIGYATVYPVAMILKILLAQALLIA